MTSGLGTRTAGRLAAAVLAASLVVALLEALVLGTVLGSLPEPVRPAPWRVAGVLGAGALVAVPLTMLFGGWGVVREQRALARELAVDEFTGIGSRRAFATALPDAVRAARAAGQPLTLGVVELADVATAVDLLGRRRTEVLVCAAATTLGAAGHGYRLSGETFAVVLPGVGPDAAFEVVDGLLAELTRAAAPLSASAGLATLDTHCPDAQMLLVGACAALDEARSLGANRVVASAEPGSGLRWLATPGHPAA